MAGPGFAAGIGTSLQDILGSVVASPVPLLEAPAGISQEAIWDLESVPAGTGCGHLKDRTVVMRLWLGSQDIEMASLRPLLPRGGVCVWLSCRSLSVCRPCSPETLLLSPLALPRREMAGSLLATLF